MSPVDSRRIGIIGHCWGGRLAWLGACRNPNYQAAAVLYGGRIKVAVGPDSTPPIELADLIPCPVIGIFGNDDQNPTSKRVRVWLSARRRGYLEARAPRDIT